MPDVAIKPALCAALRMNEIGTASPYRLSFAGKGKSGASFGFMQGDLAAKQTVVTQTFTAALAAQGFAQTRIKSLLKVLSVPSIANPLSKVDEDDIDAALLAQSALVDDMDEKILEGVYASLDKCTATAAASNRSIDPKALIYFALWINMSGPPTRLLTWIGGGEPHLPRPVPPPSAVITAEQAQTYLRATSYFVANPGNFPSFQAAAAVGAAHLPGAPVPPLALVNAAAPMLYTVPTGIGDHLVYEQATGHFLSVEAGRYDLIAVGYSGSLSRHAVNDPDQQCVGSTGPIPRGLYTLGPPGPGPSPYSIPLTPDASNDMCGRSGFLIHGDSLQHPGDASNGCIILKLSERRDVVATGLNTLVVVSRVSA